MSTKQNQLTKKQAQAQALVSRLEDEYGAGAQAPQGKPFYADFDSYVQDYPEGENYRAWLTNRGRHAVSMFLMSQPDRKGAPHGAMPGHYLAAVVSEFRGEVLLSLHDCDDGLAQRRWPLAQRVEAEQMLADMKELAPFTMWEAADHFGLNWG